MQRDSYSFSSRLRLNAGVRKLRIGPLLTSCFILVFATTTVSAEERRFPALNVIGMPGSMTLPAAHTMQDGTLAFSVARDHVHRTGALTFQATPRLTAAFRYGRFERYFPFVVYDRSFDLQFQITSEKQLLPSIAVGLRDIIGTGVLASEYIALSKAITPNLNVNSGIGWGKLGAKADFGSPFGPRPAFEGVGGEPSFRQWFRGPAAAFGSIDWQASKRLRFSLGWSGEAAPGTSNIGLATVGFHWQARPGMAVSMITDNAGNAGLGLQFSFNPRFAPSTFSQAQPPLAFGRHSLDLGNSGSIDRLRHRMARDGLILHGAQLDKDHALLRIENRRFGLASQALGRSARALTGELGPEIKQYSIELAGAGPASSRVVLKREDLLSLQDDPANAEKGWAAVRTGTARPWASSWLPEPEPYELTVRPYMALSMFDPLAPVRVDVGAQLDSKVRLMPGLSLDATFRARLAGNRNETDRFTNSALPPVRSDAGRYAVEGDAGVMRATVTHLATPMPNIYTRLSAGMLEEMFSGTVAEALWKPPSSKFALGLELAKVWQRDPGMGLGLGYYDYSAITGHASVYYAVTRDIDARADIGQYLAGDRGVTLAVERRFANGWKVGAYATLTDVPFETFGEGSFDKGITIAAPIEWIMGKPSTRTSNILVQPIQRDGGARLEGGERLYDSVRPLHDNDLERTWGMFWK